MKLTDLVEEISESHQMKALELQRGQQFQLCPRQIFHLKKKKANKIYANC